MLANAATWSSDRVERLKRCFDAGLTCSQIAREIGVTRNAVIGKMNRLGLSRPRDIIAKPLRRAAGLAGPKIPRASRPKRSRLNIFTQREILKAAFPARESREEVPIIPIHNGRGCTSSSTSPTWATMAASSPSVWPASPHERRAPMLLPCGGRVTAVGALF